MKAFVITSKTSNILTKHRALVSDMKKYRTYIFLQQQRKGIKSAILNFCVKSQPKQSHKNKKSWSTVERTYLFMSVEVL